MTPEQEIKAILSGPFDSRHTTALVTHYLAAVKEYHSAEWESSLLKSGKFVEAVIKCLLLNCGQSLPPARRFSVGASIKTLENLSGYDDVVRILIPRACVFIYDIVSNRGTRHDPDKLDPNKMDASAVLPVISWVLAELIRFAGSNLPPEETFVIVEKLTEKKYPYFEEIEGRLYVNLRGLSARAVGLLLLNAQYPKRIQRSELGQAIRRHGHTANAAAIALNRLKNVVDDEAGNWQLRGIGREEAEALLST